MSTKKLWGGRFSGTTNEFVESFTASVHFDKRLAEVDARCSQAHAKTLLTAKILSQSEYDAIVNGLDELITDIRTGDFSWDPSLEDVHMNIEARLIERIGEPGRKLHTGRSRNDQVASTFKLFLMENGTDLRSALLDLQEALLDKATSHTRTIMPGFTHLQNAQPITFGHHMMAWFEMFDRDLTRLADWHRRTSVSPMGSAALAGTSYPIDRREFQATMGFESVTRNSLDTVSDRDYAIEFVAVLSTIMMHLSRSCEEVILWMSPAFGFISLPDELCTGSSIMPQKKNPDVAELIRGKSGRVIGHLNGLLMLMKGQPLAYNRDNQEDKEAVFDALDTTLQCVGAMVLLVAGMSPNPGRMLELASQGHPTATDMADWLVRHGVAFRSAHEICGKAVALANQRKAELHELTLADLKELSDSFDDSVFECLTLEGSVAARNHLGGTAPDVVAEAIEVARTRLTELRQRSDKDA
ncbi:MAG: argininosuccinate lyase [Gammaproteobacteria bacterium]|nr:argininosuccinate lyase [Gammaproteobacteria bacterium]